MHDRRAVTLASSEGAPLQHSESDAPKTESAIPTRMILSRKESQPRQRRLVEVILQRSRLEVSAGARECTNALEGVLFIQVG